MIDVTIVKKEVSLDNLGNTDVDIAGICSRIATFGYALDVHETFISHLGVADVYVTRLPNSTKIVFRWNDDEDKPEFVIYLPDSTTRSKWRIEASLAKYIGEYIDEA